MVQYINLNRLPDRREPDWTVRQALKKDRDYAQGDRRCDHGFDFEGYCQHLAACVYGHASSGFASARAGWNGIPAAFKRHDRNPPAGAWVYYRGGTYWHVAVADTFGGIFTNDIRNGRYVKGAFSREALDAPMHAWGYPMIGWTWPYILGPQDGRTPPKVKSGKPHHDKDDDPKPLDFTDGWFEVTARSGLNGRNHPNTRSDVEGTFKRGHPIFMEKAVRNNGRRWLRADNGMWFAAEFVDRKESVKEDRREHRQDWHKEKYHGNRKGKKR